MTIEQYLHTRGLVATLLKESSVKNNLISLYEVVDDLNLSKKPEEMRKVLIPSYTFHNILESDPTSGKVLHIDPYLSEDEAIQIFMEKTALVERLEKS